MPEKEREADDDLDEDLNLFNVYPDPIHFVELLKKVDRADISSDLLLKLLENYRDMKGRPGEDSMTYVQLISIDMAVDGLVSKYRILHKLQIIMQMQSRLAEGTTSNILRKPNQLLSFIFHVLDSANMSIQDRNQDPSAPNSNSDEIMFEDGDSDDEEPGPESIGPDDELIETTITLLLSILEGQSGEYLASLKTI